MITFKGSAGRSFVPALGRVLSGGVAIRDDDAEEEEEEDDRLSARGEGGGSVSSEVIAGDVGKGGTGGATRGRGVDWGLFRRYAEDF